MIADLIALNFIQSTHEIDSVTSTAKPGKIHVTVWKLESILELVLIQNVGRKVDLKERKDIVLRGGHQCLFQTFPVYTAALVSIAKSPIKLNSELRDLTLTICLR